MSHTEADFDRLSWHDCPIWGVQFHPAEPDEGDWRSELLLDLDYIVEWVTAADGGTRFRMAPATLLFHDVSDARITIDWGRSGFRTGLHPISVGRIERERVRDETVPRGRPYYLWRVLLNWPEGGEIAFGAVGFTLTLRAEPVLSEAQALSRRERRGSGAA